MTTTDFEMAFDGIRSNVKMTGQAAHRPTLSVKLWKKFMVFLGEFGIESASLICGLSNRFYVIGIHTCSVSAKMIGLQAFRPMSYSFFPDSMVSGHSPLGDLRPGLPISLQSDCSSYPDPARSEIAPIFDDKESFINQTLAQIECPATTLVTVDETSRFSLDISKLANRVGRYWSWLTTTAFAQARLHNDTLYYKHPAQSGSEWVASFRVALDGYED